MKVRNTLLCMVLFLIYSPNRVQAEEFYNNNEKSSEGVVIERDSDIYKEVMPLAIRWKDAILNKDFEWILKNVLPEYYDPDKEALSNKDSMLYRCLYDSEFVKKENGRGVSVYEFLKNARQLKIVLVGRSPYSPFTIEAYYYDESKSTFEFPLSIEEKNRYWMTEYVVSSFAKLDGLWKLEFELQFSSPED